MIGAKQNRVSRVSKGGDPLKLRVKLLSSDLRKICHVDHILQSKGFNGVLQHRDSWKDDRDLHFHSLLFVQCVYFKKIG